MTISESTTPPVLPVATPSRTWTWLAGELRGRGRRTAAAALIGLGAAAVSTVPIYLLGTIVDRIHLGDDPSRLVGIAIVIGAAALLGGLGTGLSTYLVNRLGEQLVADLREGVLERALDLPATMIEGGGRGDLLARVGPDVAAVARAVAQVLPTMLNGLFLGVVTLVGMTSLDWRLGLAGAVCIPAYVLGLRWYLPRSSPLYTEQRLAIAARTQAGVESLQGIRTVDAYEIHDDHLAEIEAASARVRSIEVGGFTLFTRLVARVNRSEFVGLAAILVVGFLLVRTGAGSVGQVTAAALMFHRLFNPIGMLMYNFDEIQAAGACLARLVGVLDLPRPGPRESASARLPRGSDVEIDHVSFRYTAGPEVLRSVSLRIPAGTRCALVGATGAGKSTLAALVAGLYAPTAGQIRIGGVPVGDIEGEQLRRWVATISQEIHVFSGPLIDDLRLAAPTATREQVWAALRQVGADRWVQSLEQDVDTPVGEHGTTLSATQAQHIALARLVLADPEVAVLDEATAEAGSAHATELDAAVEAATRGRTTLVVAHRLGQAAVADQVVVMDDGRIVEQGTHADLLAHGGRYARLWQAWRTHA